MRQFQAIAISLAVLGCGAPAVHWGSASEAILDGRPDAEHAGVIVVRNPRGTCTGTVLSAHLVLTARHCVATEDGGSVPCTPFADSGGPSVPTYTGNVPPGDVTVSLTRTSPALATAVAFFDDAGASGCGHDLAIVQLGAALALPASSFRASPPSAGEAVTAVGWGVIDDARTPAAQRYAKDAAILALGPARYSYHPYDDASQGTNEEPVVSGELLLTSGTTGLGDSGGPAFDASDAIVGTVARGFAHPAYGPTHLSSTAAHLDVFAAAFRATGETPAPASAPKTSAGVASDASARGCATTSGAGWLALVAFARRYLKSKGKSNLGG